MAENSNKSGVSTPDEQRSGILGINERLGLGTGTKKRVPKKKPEMMGYGNMPNLADIKLAERTGEGSMVPGAEMGSPLDRAKNKVARSFRGGNKMELFNRTSGFNY